MSRVGRVALSIVAMGATTIAVLVVGQSPSQAALITCNTIGTSNDAYVPAIWPSFTPFDCQLRPGDRGRAVEQLQNTMDICYSENLIVDGQFGPLTEAALKRVQARAGTWADGIYGPYTRRAMLHQRTSGHYCGRVP